MKVRERERGVASVRRERGAQGKGEGGACYHTIVCMVTCMAGTGQGEKQAT